MFMESYVLVVDNLNNLRLEKKILEYYQCLTMRKRCELDADEQQSKNS
jgi:hypothetical protein